MGGKPINGGRLPYLGRAEGQVARNKLPLSPEQFKLRHSSQSCTTEAIIWSFASILIYLPTYLGSYLPER